MLGFVEIDRLHAPSLQERRFTYKHCLVDRYIASCGCLRYLHTFFIFIKMTSMLQSFRAGKKK